MRWPGIITLLVFTLLMSMLAGPTRGAALPETDDQQAAADAAATNAMHNLLTDIESESIDQSTTVGDFIAKTHSQERLTKIVATAQRIGRPRWLDDGTCQVQMEIAGSNISAVLAQISTDDAAQSPLAAARLELDLKSWDGRVFSAMGASSTRIDSIHPPASNKAWRGASDEQIRTAIHAARQAAVKHVLDSIRGISLSGKKTIGDALDQPAVGGPMANWIGNRPVMLVDFREDRTVSVTLAASAAKVSAQLLKVLAAQNLADTNEKDWNTIAREISEKMEPAVGVASLTATTRPTPVVLFAKTPDWIDRQLDAQGVSPPAATILRAAHDAETTATVSLRAQIRALSAGPNVTLGQAADADPRLAAAIDRALQRGAHVYSVDYRADGTVNARMSIDLRDLWQEIISPVP